MMSGHGNASTLLAFAEWNPVIFFSQSTSDGSFGIFIEPGVELSIIWDVMTLM